MIKLINKNETEIVFITDMSVALANALRRSVNYVPVFAIDSLEISKNDSALYDEVIAHRLGLVPLKNENLRMPSECDCEKEEGCGKCAVKMKLSTKGPCVVYSDELSPKGSSIYKIPITILDQDQELEFVAIGKMGKGIEHAKFCPGLLYYKYNQEDTNDEGFKKLLEEVKKEKDVELEMHVETWGQMPTKEIFLKSIDALSKELKDFSKAIK